MDHGVDDLVDPLVGLEAPGAQDGPAAVGLGGPHRGVPEAVDLDPVADHVGAPGGGREPPHERLALRAGDADHLAGALHDPLAVAAGATTFT